MRHRSGARGLHQALSDAEREDIVTTVASNNQPSQDAPSGCVVKIIRGIFVDLRGDITPADTLGISCIRKQYLAEKMAGMRTKGAHVCQLTCTPSSAYAYDLELAFQACSDYDADLFTTVTSA